jgi:hypothetical protein
LNYSLANQEEQIDAMNWGMSEDFGHWGNKETVTYVEVLGATA